MRNLRLLLVTLLGYNPIISSFYRRNPHLKKLSYSDHKNALIDYCPVHLNSFSRCMKRLGHECDEIVYDLESLQKTWAKESNVSYGSVNWQEDIMMEQILAYKPELILFQGAPPLSGWLVNRLKEIVPSLRKIVVYNGYPLNIKDIRGIDLMMCASPQIVDQFKKQGVKAELLYYYFDENVTKNLKGNDLLNNRFLKPIDLSFVGFSGYGGAGNAHHSRFKFLTELLHSTNISMWLSEGNTRDPNLNPDTKPLLQSFPDRTHDGVFGLDMYNILQNSLLTVNKHTDAKNGNVGNMRMFEATGVGSCLITDSGNNITDLFEPNHEIVTFNSNEDCMQKIDYLLNNKNYARKIGKNALKRVTKYHSLTQRCKEIDQFFNDLL